MKPSNKGKDGLTAFINDEIWDRIMFSNEDPSEITSVNFFSDVIQEYALKLKETNARDTRNAELRIGNLTSEVNKLNTELKNEKQKLERIKNQLAKNIDLLDRDDPDQPIDDTVFVEEQFKRRILKRVLDILNEESPFDPFN